MNRLLICTAIGLFLGLTPALALDDATTVPGAHTSSSAAQQSSSPPGSKSAMENDAEKSNEATNPSEGTIDTSSGPAQQSSAPAANLGKTNSSDPSKTDKN